MPVARPIATAPTDDPERTLLLFCPEQGGWHTGLFCRPKAWLRPCLRRAEPSTDTDVSASAEALPNSGRVCLSCRLGPRLSADEPALPARSMGTSAAWPRPCLAQCISFQSRGG